MKKTIVVLGAGSGCGNRVAEKFGNNDFRVILMARNAEHLAEYEKEFNEKGIEVFTKVADAAQTETVTKAFDEVKAEFGVPDVLCILWMNSSRFRWIRLRFGLCA